MLFFANTIIAEEAWNITTNFCVFGKDFELTMIQSFKEREDESKTIYGDSKPIIAKTMAVLLVKNKDKNDSRWKRFSELKDMLMK